jgi:hypothetical protein
MGSLLDYAIALAKKRPAIVVPARRGERRALATIDTRYAADADDAPAI